MLQDGNLRQDFRFRGFPNQSMQSPRQPITAPISEDKKRNEENFVKVFGKSSIFDPAHHTYWKPPEAKKLVAPESSMGDSSGNWMAAPARPRIDEGHRGLQYGTDQIDNSPRIRGMNDLLQDKSPAEKEKLRHMQSEANDDIRKYRQEKMMQDFQREEEKRRENELQSKYYPWDRLYRGHGAPKGDNRRRKFLENDHNPRDTVTYTREPQKPQRGHDLFLDTLGGPGGTVVRQNGGPGLQSMPDPRQGAYRSPGPGGSDVKSPRRPAYQNGPSNDRYQPPNAGYEPSFGVRGSTPSRSPHKSSLFDEPRREEQRSLDLEATRGGAGAPLKDDRGKAITRFPVTMVRDDYGTSKIQENIPGKRYTLPEEPIYDPFGKPGGGAPMKDRYGNRNTHTFGNFERLGDSAEKTKQVRAKEVMLNDLRQGMEEQQRKKEQWTRELKAPYGELAEVIRSKEVGQPKRDPITGSLANQHLPNSDVSKIKMNYQPVADADKKALHNYLKEQVEENHRNRQLDSLRNRHESNMHFREFDQQWGNFGGGAPKDRTIRKKVNLDNALYHYDQRETRSEDTHRERQPHYGLETRPKPQNASYQKRFLEDDIRHVSSDVSPRYVKNTTKSTSRNLYEYPSDRSVRTVQKASAPYATNSAHYAY